MLKELFLENFVFVNSLLIPFERGFNVISGETGAGKTLLLQALNLISGERSDFELIKKGSEKASIQAIFEIKPESGVYTHLDQNSIEIHPDEYLIIKRELYSHGKTKILINRQLASIALLKKISPFLFHTVSQSIHVQLKNEKFQRDLLDEDHEIQQALKVYQKVFVQENKLINELDFFNEKLQKKSVILEKIIGEIEELSGIEFSDDLENQLFEKFKILSNKEEIFEKINTIIIELSANEALFSKLLEYGKTLNKLSGLDDKLKKTADHFLSLSHLLNEILSDLDSYLYNLNYSKASLTQIDNELSKLKSIKKRYGPTYEDAKIYLEKIRQERNFLENLEESIKIKKTQLSNISSQKTTLSNTLSSLRQKRAEFLSKTVTDFIHKLDMSYFEFSISLTKTDFSAFGSENISFLLKSNGKNNFLSLAERASGGELSRILLSLYLAQKEQHMETTLIFDEIDANIGGETATKVGEMLYDLGKASQIICITHFPQVAKSANHHLKLSKSIQNGNITSFIQVLSEKEKSKELIRMLGGVDTLTRVNVDHPN